jgi:proline iminopeptidase
METFVETGDARLWTIAEGEGVPVILCPGGPGCCDYLEPVANLLQGRARTIRFDPRGCGRSSLAANYTFEQSLADLETIRTHYGIEHWVVAGHSAGAEMALAYALAHPERTRGLVCLSGGRIVDDRDWHDSYARGRDAGLEPSLDYAFPTNLDVNAQLNAERKRWIKTPELLRQISELETPAVFVYGTEDIRPSWPVEQVAALLPSAEMHMLKRANHNLWLTHPEELGGLLRDFVAGL